MKQAILIRSDLKLGKGKIAAQSSHASVAATLKSKKETVTAWKKQGMKKVVLKVETLRELNKYELLAKKENLITAKIKDSGKTQISPGTITALAIGPDKEEKISKITYNLKLV